MHGERVTVRPVSSETAGRRDTVEQVALRRRRPTGAHQAAAAQISSGADRTLAGRPGRRAPLPVLATSAKIVGSRCSSGTVPPATIRRRRGRALPGGPVYSRYQPAGWAAAVARGCRDAPSRRGRARGLDQRRVRSPRRRRTPARSAARQAVRRGRLAVAVALRAAVRRPARPDGGEQVAAASSTPSASSGAAAGASGARPHPTAPAPPLGVVQSTPRRRPGVAGAGTRCRRPRTTAAGRTRSCRRLAAAGRRSRTRSARGRVLG